MSEETTPQPESATPVEARYLLEGSPRVYESEAGAVTDAWHLSQSKGCPVTIYRLTPQPIGVVSAATQAA